MQESAGLISILCTIPVAQNGVKSPWEMSDPRPEEGCFGAGTTRYADGAVAEGEPRPDIGLRVRTGSYAVWHGAIRSPDGSDDCGDEPTRRSTRAGGIRCFAAKEWVHRTSTEREGRRLLYADAGGGSVERRWWVNLHVVSVCAVFTSARPEQEDCTPDFTGVRQALWSMHGSRTGRLAWSMELGATPGAIGRHRTGRVALQRALSAPLMRA